MTHRKLKTHARGWDFDEPDGLIACHCVSLCSSIIDELGSKIWSDTPTCKHCDRILKKKRRVK